MIRPLRSAPAEVAEAKGPGVFRSLAMRISGKAQARAAEDNLQALRAEMEAKVAELNAQVKELQTAQPGEPERSNWMAVQGLNLTTRTKALRMNRRGETISSIAAALGVQQKK